MRLPLIFVVFAVFGFSSAQNETTTHNLDEMIQTTEPVPTTVGACSACASIPEDTSLASKLSNVSNHQFLSSFVSIDNNY